MSESEVREFLFVRHAIERKRSDGENALKLLREPFQSHGSISTGHWNGGGTYEISIGSPASFAMLVGRFPKHDWLSVEFVGGSAQEVLDANKTVGRLEFLRLQYRGPRKISLLEVRKKGERLVSCSISEDGAFEITGKSVPSALNDVATAKEAVSAIRTHYQCESPLRVLTVSDATDSTSPARYAVIKETGQPLKPRACAVSVTRGPNRVSQKRACRSLEKAIDAGDLDGIQAAIAAGASLTHLIEGSTSPLELALIRMDGPDRELCAKALVDAGAPVNGLLAGCFENYYRDEWCIAATRFLIACGADVNEPGKDGYGYTPIARAVQRTNVEAIQLLLAAGADPHALMSDGKSTIVDWLRSCIEAQGGNAIFAEILTLLTGE